jgi:hypothetical protein
MAIRLIAFFICLSFARISSNAVQYKDVTTELLNHWVPKTVSIPAVGELSKYLGQPLHERAKIPLCESRFNSHHFKLDAIGR